MTNSLYSQLINAYVEILETANDQQHHFVLHHEIMTNVCAVNITDTQCVVKCFNMGLMNMKAIFYTSPFCFKTLKKPA